jgi:dTDP-4-amino-4,6-dideoxygalactose transaminase
MLGDEEKQVVQEVLSGSMLVHGPRSKDFEAAFAAYTGAPHAVSVSSCTAALHLSYFYLGLGPGDEVIVPAQTHTATAHAVELCGARPVFVDAELETGNIDIDQIESAITSRTRAISIVHFLGMPVDMRRVCDIASKHDCFVVEDSALALGTYLDGVHAGLHGDVGCFSFYPVKHMTTLEGGMLITKNDDIAARVERQRAFGVDRTPTERKVPGVYDVTQLGYNYRMNEVQAAIGVEQLKRMDGFLEKRKANDAVLREGLAGVDEVSLLQTSHDEYQSSYYCTSILLSDELQPKRFEIVSVLKAKGVGTSVYYPRPVPHMSYYAEKYGYGSDTFPVASKISYGSIALPVGPHLDADDMAYVVDAVKEAVRI